MGYGASSLMWQRMGFPIFQPLFISILLLIICGFVPLNVKASWILTPQLRLTEIYTDNIMLAGRGLEKEEYITQIGPEISLTGKGAKSEVNLKYRLDNLLYANEGDRNTVNHYMVFDASRTSFDKHLFIDTYGSYTQSIINAKDTAPANSFFLTKNRTDTVIFNVSPYLRGRFGEGINTEVRAYYGLVDYLGVDGLNSRVEKISAFLDGREIPGKISWVTKYNRRVTNYEDRPSVIFENIEGELNVELVNRLNLLLIIGQESNRFPHTDSSLDLEDTFWRTGVRWQPSRRTFAETTYGERFFGETYSLRLNHRGHYVDWNIEYMEDLQTIGLEMLVRKYNGVNEALLGETPSLTNEIFILKRWSGNIRRTKGRSSINIRFLQNQRDYQERQTTETSSVANISWVWKFASRTRSTLSYAASRRQFSDIGRTDKVGSYTFDLTRIISRSLIASARYRYDMRLSTDEINEYNVNTLFMQLRVKF